MLVLVNQVIPHNAEPSRRNIKRMEVVLLKQGQIEPLQVKKFAVENGKQLYTTFTQDAWASEIVHAARNLGWTTLLISEMKRYEY